MSCLKHVLIAFTSCLSVPFYTQFLSGEFSRPFVFRLFIMDQIVLGTGEGVEV